MIMMTIIINDMQVDPADPDTMVMTCTAGSVTGKLILVHYRYIYLDII